MDIYQKPSTTRSNPGTNSHLESLSTNVTIEGAVQAALRKLEYDIDLANRTNLSSTQIADLLNFVLRSTYFQYNGSIYKQQDGAVVGSPVSAVIANIYIEDLRKKRWQMRLANLRSGNDMLMTLSQS